MHISSPPPTAPRAGFQEPCAYENVKTAGALLYVGALDAVFSLTAPNGLVARNSRVVIARRFAVL